MFKRRLIEQVFLILCTLVTGASILLLGVLLFHIFREGYSYLSWDFLTNYPSRFPQHAGIKSALFGSLWLMGLTILFAVPLGVLSAIYIEEFAPRNRILRLLDININNLAGMPSIVYGMLGLALFVRFLGLDRSLWAGSLTLSLLSLPVIVIAAQGAIRAVPQSIREAAYALGARKWQVVFLQVLPAALPGILTGIILSVSRAIGEAAPLIMIGALSFVAFTPSGPSDSFTALPIQIFNWASRPKEEFHQLAASAIIVLIVVLFALNVGAIVIREKLQRYRS